METSITKHNHVVARKERMDAIALELKKRFIGLDEIIDGIISLITAWYIFPEAQLRPLIINLWGLTGSGKTALVKSLVELLDHKEYYAHFDMGEFESESARWIKRSFIDDLAHFNGQQPFICLDEFQFARSIKRGEEVTNDKLRMIWELLDSGKIFFTADPNQYYVRRIVRCINDLRQLKHNGGEIKNGEVVAGQELFLELFESCFLDSNDRSNMNIKYLKSDDFIAGLLELDDAITPKDFMLKQVCSMDLEALIVYMTELVKQAVSPRELDLRQSVIFILGNLDEAYRMSTDLNPDLDADNLHDASKKITIANIKNALATRFRSEQIARLGNNHFLYAAFSREQFMELIRRELERLAVFVEEGFALKVMFDYSVNEIVYAEGVIPSQGTRPVFTTINNLVQSRVGAIVMHAHSEKASSVRWAFRDHMFYFELIRDNEVVRTVKEKVNLLLESRRTSVDPHIQAHIAVHEVGHGLLAALLLRIIPSVIVSRSASHDAEGFCRVRYPEGPFTRDTIRKCIVITLGGFVAERMIFGEEYTCSGVSSDIEHASTLANDAVRRYAMGSDPVRLAVVRNYDNEDFFVDSSLYEKESVQLIRDCIKAAELVLERNKLLLLKMSEYLTYNSKMDRDMIEFFVKEYSVEAWVKESGFVEPNAYFSFHKTVEEQLATLSMECHYPVIPRLDRGMSESLV